MTMPRICHHGYLAFSLRTLFVVLTVLGIWLGVIVHRAREQREAVKAIEAMGGVIVYDWQPQPTPRSKGKWTSRKIAAKRWTWHFSFDLGNAAIPGPEWLRGIIGDDFFQSVEGVAFIGVSTVKSHFTDEGIREWIPALKRLRTLRTLIIEGDVSEEMMAELKAALPDCTVKQYDYYTFPKG